MPVSGLAAGLMSGTSADGVSVALAEFSGRSFRVLDYRTYGYPARLSARILRAPESDAAEIARLNFELGRVFADALLKVLRRNRVRAAQVAVVGSHGQTVHHGPRDRPPCTLQIGEPALIAQATGLTVVSDFRCGDIAAGGEGAPLLPFFDRAFFSGGPLRSLQNIGGIANLAVVGPGAGAGVAFDTGPGNCLMDWAARRATKGREPFDRNGRIAAKGRVRMDLIQPLLRHAYFRREPPKSCGRELFNPSFLPKALARLAERSPADALATLNYFTALTIFRAHRDFVLSRYRVRQLVVSGGGALNHTLMRHLQSLFHPLAVVPISAFGLHPQAKEPLAFAFYAWQALRGRPNHLPSATGAAKAVLLGKITPGRRFKCA